MTCLEGRGTGLKCYCFMVMLLLFSATVRADWLLLLHADAQGKLSERWEAKVETEVKFRDDMSEFYDSEIMPWVACRFTDWFKLGAGWRQLYSRKNTVLYRQENGEDDNAPSYEEVASHYWQVEQRPLMDFMFSVKPKAWTVDDRIRVEYRNIEDTDPYFRYRNRLRLTAPWAWTKAGIKPWVAWETYYEDSPDWEGDRWNRNRLYVGLAAKLSKTIKSGCYYYRERVLTAGSSESNNEIGFDISFVF